MNIELKYKVDLAIQLLCQHKELLTYDKIIYSFKKNGISEILANDIYIFLPIIFCQKLLPTVNFHSSYYEQNSNGNKTEKIFTENPIYNIIKLSADDYFQDNPNGEMVLKIASLSAEFSAINNVLIDGGKLEEIKLTKTIILK